MEDFWSLLKREINGTYVNVEPYHLFRYLDEQAFRFNDRKLTDGDGRFWDRWQTADIDQLTGKTLEEFAS
jgi:hypothetical protein